MPTPTGFQQRSQNPLLPESVYKAVIAQASTSAPTVTYLICNSTGTSMTWGYTSTGVYTLTAGTAVFTAGRVFVKFNWGGTATTCLVTVTSTTVLTFTFGDSATPSAAQLAGTGFLEVEIYPA